MHCLRAIGLQRWEMPNMTPLSCTWDEHKAVIAAREAFHDFQFRRMGIDGKMRYISISGMPVFGDDGQFRGYRGIGCDITATKLAEEALRESEARFRALTELSSDFYWETDTEHRMSDYRFGPNHQTGMPREWLLGKRRWELPSMRPLSATWEEHKALLMARKPFRDFEFSRLGEDGFGSRHVREIEQLEEPIDRIACLRGGEIR